MTVMKQMKNLILDLTISEKEFDDITAPVLTGAPPRARICRNIPGAVLYEDLEHQGSALYNSYIIMSLGKLKEFLDNMWKETVLVLGKSIQISMELFKLELCVKGSIFELDVDIFRYLRTEYWIILQLKT